MSPSASSPLRTPARPAPETARPLRPDPVLQLLAFAGVGLPPSAAGTVAPASVALAARAPRRRPSRPAPVSVLEAHAKVAVAA